MNKTARDTARSLVLLVSVVAFIIGAARPALAGWPLPTLGDGVGFGESYSTGDGGVFTHGGLDISAAAGSPVSAPLAGTIVFVGRVPAGEGTTQLAVSLLLDTGETLSLMPFEQVAVERGATVAEGGVLGTLAAQGDRSSAEEHLHVGLRRGSLYLDPLTVLSPPALGEGVVSEPESATETVAQPAIQAPASAVVADAVPSHTAGAVDAPLAPLVAIQAPAPSPSISLNRIPDIRPSLNGEGADFLSATAYGGDAEFLEGITRIFGSRHSVTTVLLASCCALTGLLACLGAVRSMARRTTPDETPDDSPVRKVAAAAGRW